MKKKNNNESDDDNNNNITVVNNHIYFYNDINNDSCCKLNNIINGLSKYLQKQSIDFDSNINNIFLHIKSEGGCILSAFSVIDTIINSKVNIISIVEGAVASAATIISMVCHKRIIKANAFMLIHQLRSSICGKYEELKDDFINDTKIMNKIYKLYIEYTNLNINSIKKILKHDIWWDSSECIKSGIVDELYDNESLKNIIFLKKNTKKRLSISIEEDVCIKKRR